MAQRNMKYIPSFGNGYGINANVPGDKKLEVAVPPLARVTVNPGSGFSRKAVGRQMSGSHFSGAKLHKRTAK